MTDWRQLKIYEGIEGFGPTDADGVVYIGTDLEIIFEMEVSYLKAARILLVSGPVADLVTPIGYLQRHAFELALKQLLKMAYWIQWARLVWTAGGLPKEKRQEVPFQHNLATLASIVTKALREIGHELPEDFIEVADFLSFPEKGDETRWRYPTGKPQARGNRLTADPLQAVGCSASLWTVGHA